MRCPLLASGSGLGEIKPEHSLSRRQNKDKKLLTKPTKNRTIANCYRQHGCHNRLDWLGVGCCELRLRSTPLHLLLCTDLTSPEGMPMWDLSDIRPGS